MSSREVYVPPQPRAELKADNVLSTKLFDTLAPALSKHIRKITEYEVEFHKLLSGFLPLNRREELLEHERDLREKQVSAWRFLNDWVLEGLAQFVQDSVGLFDALQAKGKNRNTEGRTRTVYEQATIVGDRCLCARAYTSSIIDVWKGMGEVIQYYGKRPIPMAKRDQSLTEVVTSTITGVWSYFRKTSTHTSPEDYTKLINLADRIHLEWKDIHASLDDLNQFFTLLSELYLRNELVEKWGSSLDLSKIRQDWVRIGTELDSGRRAVKKCQALISDLPAPLMQ